MTSDLSFPCQIFPWAHRVASSRAREVHLIFEPHLFHPQLVQPWTWGHASGMCASKRRPDESSKFALQSSQKGLLPPLGGWINGLAGRYTPTANLSPDMRLNVGSLVLGSDSTCVPKNVLCPSFVERSPRRSHSPLAPR